MRWLAPLAIACCTPINTPPTEPTAEGRWPIVCEQPGGVAGAVQLFLVDEEGTAAPLTEPPTTPIVEQEPAWSPDGRWIAYASSRDRDDPARASLWIIDARAVAGKPEPRRLTDDAGSDRQPSFSPDGKRLVFASTRADGRAHLFTLEITGGAPVQLTSGAADDYDPSWSHDGKRIAFTTDRSGVARIAIMPAGGGAAVELADGRTPVFTPDDAHVVFAAFGEAGRTDLDIWEMATDGSGARDLAPSSLGDETDPRLSVDGRWLFASSSVKASVPGGVVTFALIVVADLSAAAKLEAAERDGARAVLDLPLPPSPELRPLVGNAATQRFGVAVAPVPLDARALARTKSYADALVELVH